VGRVIDVEGGVDVIVNNAGASAAGPLPAPERVPVWRSVEYLLSADRPFSA